MNWWSLLTVRNVAKEGLARAHALFGRNTASRLTARHTLLVLCYHRVLPRSELDRAPFPGICVAADRFERHLTCLRRHYEVLPLSAALARWPDADRPLAAVTFDDGYADNYRVAWPVLRRLGIAATIFLVSDHVDRADLLWFDAFALAVREAERHAGARRRAVAFLEQEGGSPVARALEGTGPFTARVHGAVTVMKGLPAGERTALIRGVRSLVPAPDVAAAEHARLMTWAEVADMAAGGIEFGSHTATHPILPGLDRDRLHDEIAGSKATLEKRIGQPVKAFCYPNGDHDERVVAEVKAAGYQCAVTTRAAPNTPETSPFQLNREYVGPRTGVGLGGRVSPAVFTAELLHLL